MRYVVPLERVTADDQPRVGGKAVSLAALVSAGIAVPRGICVTVEAYESFVRAGGLAQRIGLEVARKRFEDMRWEEIWDASLRIRNECLRAPVPVAVRAEISQALSTLGDRAVVVRSSSPGEDGVRDSFAGLHESFVNVKGETDTIDHVKLVWASLWSDRAWVYRHERGLDSLASRMAVLVQVLEHGQQSGVVFGRSPMSRDESVVEAVHGLNQGLVDGSIEPDRWTLARDSGTVLRHDAPARTHWMVPASSGVVSEALPDALAEEPPLDEAGVRAVWSLARDAERIFGGPQDVEFTWVENALVGLQSRPITTAAGGDATDRSREQTLEGLERLHERIVGDLLPAVDRAAEGLARRSLAGTSDEAVAERIEERLAAQQRHADVYTVDFIPFAHGIRLFGQVYNDAMRPDDPFAFVELLAGAGLEGMQRNGRLELLADQLRRDPELHAQIVAGDWDRVRASFVDELDAFVSDYGYMTWLGSRCVTDRTGVGSLLIQMARGQRNDTGRSSAAGEQAFLASFAPDRRAFARRVLRIGKESYRLRDDDNLHVGRIEGLVDEAVQEGRRRLAARGADASRWSAGDVVRALREPGFEPEAEMDQQVEPSWQGRGLRGRQLLGQPAGRGVGVGPARVVRQPSDLFAIQRGEVLVCDSIDPNMTFVAPLLEAIVERRGGMLIHGAIVAREYGIPCVTGIPNATELIETGELVTVDGFLGIVSVGTPVGVPVREAVDLDP